MRGTMTHFLSIIAFVLGLVLATNAQGAGGEVGLRISVVVDDVEHSKESFNDLLTKNFYSPNGIWKISEDDGMVHIPYQYSEHTLEPVNDEFMQKAFEEWQKNTCVSFYEMGPSDSMTGNHLNIFSGKWCQANLGPLWWTATNVSMYERCGQPGYIHELGHALGLCHMHNRSDRDKYLKLAMENVIPGRESAFKKQETNNYDVEWDYTSVMLYHPSGFSKNGKLTMVPKDSRWYRKFGYPPLTSFMDTKIINRAFKCDKAFLKKCHLQKDPCMNGGYMGPECECLCPPGTDDDNCKEKKMSYNDAMLKKWHPNTKVFTKPGIVSSPNYPNTPTAAFKGLTILQAPKCKRVVLTFLEDLDLIYRRKYDNECVYDWLKFSNAVDDYNPSSYCNKELQKGKVIKSTGSELFIELRLQIANGFVRKGYKASWTTEDIPGCS